jgi:hypothetical protein
MILKVDFGDEWQSCNVAPYAPKRAKRPTTIATVARWGFPTWDEAKARFPVGTKRRTTMPA